MNCGQQTCHSLSLKYIHFHSASFFAIALLEELKIVSYVFAEYLAIASFCFSVGR